MTETSLITQEHLGFAQKAKIAEDRALDLLMQDQQEKKPLEVGEGRISTDTRAADIAEAQVWATLANSLRSAALAQTIEGERVELSETIYNASGRD